MTLPNAMKIFLPNSVDANTEISVSSGGDTAKFIADGKRDTYWESVGEDSDAIVSTIELAFKNDVGGIVAHDYDHIAMLNTNWKQGGGEIIDMNNNFWYMTSLGAFFNNDTDFLLDMNRVLIPSRIPKKIILLPQFTKNINEEKKIGEIMILKLVLELNALTQFNRQDDAKEGHFRTHNGPLIKWTEFTKFGGELTIQNLTQEQRDTLQEALTDNEFLTYAFYSDYDPTAIYTMALASRPVEVFERKTQLFTLTLNLKQK